jgi:hypothetical protein
MVKIMDWYSFLIGVVLWQNVMLQILASNSSIWFGSAKKLRFLLRSMHSPMSGVVVSMTMKLVSFGPADRTPHYRKEGRSCFK